MSAAIYCRISKDRTGAGLGVERQAADCRKLAESLGLDVKVVLTDNDISAYSGKHRPGYEELLRLIEVGEIDTVIAWHTDRLHRRLRDLLDYTDIVERSGTKTITVKAGDIDLSTSHGITMAQVAGAMAEGYVRTNTEKLKRAKLQSAQAGKFSGGQRPYGFEPGCTAIREVEAAVVRELADRVIRGESFRSLAMDLNERGVLTTHGKQWNALKVRNLLSHKRYAGIREHHDAEYHATWPAILRRETWESLQAAIKLNAAHYKQRGPGRKYLLTGFAICGVCGLKMHTKPRGDGKSFRYVCTKHRIEGPDGCGTVTRNIAPTDQLITEAVLYRLDTDNLAEALRSREGDSAELKTLVYERDASSQKVVDLIDDYASGLLDRAQFTRAKATAEAALSEAEKKLEVHTRAEAGAQLMPVGTRVRDAWEKADIDWRRRVLALLIDRVIIHKSDTTGMTKAQRWHGYVFKPDDIEVIWLK